jgi:hypothetical protein
MAEKEKVNSILLNGLSLIESRPSDLKTKGIIFAHIENALSPHRGQSNITLSDKDS